jgi:hypothetical protein
MEDAGGLIFGVVVMLAIVGLGFMALMDEDNQSKKPSKRRGKLEKYFDEVQRRREPPRKVSDEEISPYQGLGGKKQKANAASAVTQEDADTQQREKCLG